MTKLEMARAIVNDEARRDRTGKLLVYRIPRGDGGGDYEAAGINDRFHPGTAARLARLIEAGKHDEAEEQAAIYIANYTVGVTSWGDLPAGIEYFLRDCAFNRGPVGSAKIAQRALGVRDDGIIGPVSKAAMRDALAKPFALLARLRMAREDYELDVAGRREQFWRGLVNRWDNVTERSGRAIAAG